MNYSILFMNFMLSFLKALLSQRLNTSSSIPLPLCFPFLKGEIENSCNFAFFKFLPFLILALCGAEAKPHSDTSWAPMFALPGRSVSCSHLLSHHHSIQVLDLAATSAHFQSLKNEVVTISTTGVSLRTGFSILGAAITSTTRAAFFFSKSEPQTLQRLT